jgi:hypothetical protein
MKTMIRPDKVRRTYWLVITLLFVALVSIGGYWWFEQAAVKYDRITNAKRV